MICIPRQCIVAVTFCLILCLLSVGSAQSVDFVEQVQPIFVSHCYACHGPSKQVSGYRLDNRNRAMAGGESGVKAIVSRDPESSELIRYIEHADPELAMPPADSGSPRLSPEQIGILRDWIQSGADWPDSASVQLEDGSKLWSLQPLSRSKYTSDLHPVDAHLLPKLRAAGLGYAPRTDARTLCRRMYYDLHGLPPTPEQMSIFCRDFARDPDKAVYALVDTLLSSPRYGERMARYWLDIVHYGDTHGYDKDQPRPNAWPYRDYLIRSFNEDKSFHRFIEEQIAGDVLFPTSPEAVEALGFLAAGPWDLIGHAEVSEDKTDGKIARHLDRDNIVANTIGTFCSVTVQCAQCHQHKFDPISQEDYYSLQAVFAAIDRTNKTYDTDPSLSLLRQQLGAFRLATTEHLNSIEAEAVAKGGEAYQRLQKEITKARSQKSSSRPSEHGWHSAIAQHQDDVKWIQLNFAEPVKASRIVMIAAADDFNNIGEGFGFPLRFVIEVQTVKDVSDGKEAWKTVFSHTESDFKNPGCAPQTYALSTELIQAVRVTATKLAPRQNDYIFALGELQCFSGDNKNIAPTAKVTSGDSIEALPRWSRSNLIDGIYAQPATEQSLVALETSRDQLRRSLLSQDQLIREIRLSECLKRINDEIKSLPPPKVVYAGSIHQGSGAFAGTGSRGGRPRAIHVLQRGQVTKGLKEVGPGALAAVSVLPSRFDYGVADSDGLRRGALAKWLSDSTHPLVWRSIVNRVWQMHFGRGIVVTANDFGNMGTAPSHPELLDALAHHLLDHGGSLKSLHRLILTSHAYQQCSSRDSRNGPALDPDNRLVWRQQRRKLDAEAVRDSVLAVSGSMDWRMGGPGWQDFVVTNPAHSPHYEYGLHDPKDSKTFRRSVYRFLVRSQTEPFMTVLDCADPSMRVEKRNESVTPAQSLALLNNGFMLYQSTRFANRIEQEIGTDIEMQIQAAAQLALCRSLTDSELEELKKFVREHGLASYCRLLFNLNEFHFVD